MNIDLRRRVAVLLALAFVVLTGLAGLESGSHPQVSSDSKPAVLLASHVAQAAGHLETSALPAEPKAGSPAEVGQAAPPPAVDRPRPAIVAAPTGRSPPFSR